jgi:RNA polymerase sigma-70 factor (ECF subfamily)
VSKGNEHAFAQLFNKYSDKLYSFVVSISGSNQVAEDVVQDVFLKIWQKGHELNEIENFHSYLFKMARNHVLNIMKRMAKETLILSETAYEFSGRKQETFRDIEFKDTQHYYRKAIEKLPPQQKLVFIMSREKGLNQQEIAKNLNISIPTVKSHMTQALRFLRKKLEGAYPTIIIYCLMIFRS